MMKPEFVLPITVTPDQLNQIATDLAAREFVPKPKGGLRLLDSGLLALKQKLLKEEAVELYLKYRGDIVKGGLDKYGRPGFLQTVPSETDSAARSTLLALDYPEESLEAEGPCYRVFRATHQKNDFSLSQIWSLTGEKREILTGKMIVVPVGPWVGDYVYLFAADSRTGLALWTKEREEDIDYEQFTPQIEDVLMEREMIGNFSSRGAAIIYACSVLSDVLPGDKRLDQVFSRLSVDKNKILDEAKEFFLGFKFPKGDNLAALDLYQKDLAGMKDSAIAVQRILFRPEEHSNDPGLVTYAISKILEGDTYSQIAGGIFGAISQSIGEIQGLIQGDQSLLGHKLRYSSFESFDYINIPWQASIILGNKILEAGIQCIDPEFKPGQSNFSLMHVPQDMLPEDLASAANASSAVLKNGYFNMPRLLELYNRLILEKQGNNSLSLL